MNEYKPKETIVEPQPEIMNPSHKIIVTRCFKLPCIGKKCCMDEIDAKFIFDTFKICRYFYTKDPVPKSLISHVVYHFTCAGCNTCYIGETARRLETRVKEHLRTDNKSAVYKHLSGNEACNNIFDRQCFTVLDTAHTKLQLAIKESIYIKERDPTLNKQVYCYKLNLLV